MIVLLLMCIEENLGHRLGLYDLLGISLLGFTWFYLIKKECIHCFSTYEMYYSSFMDIILTIISLSGLEIYINILSSIKKF